MREFLIRVRIILILLFFMVLVTILFIFPGQVADFAQALDDQDTLIRILMGLTAILADVGMGFLVFRELEQIRHPGSGDGLTVRSREANVQVSVQSVQSNLDSHLKQIEGLHTVNTRVASQQGRVSIKLDITADDSVDIRKKIKEINKEIEQVVENQMGVRVAGKPVINLQLSTGAPIPVEADVPRRPGIFRREKKETQEPNTIPLDELKDTQTGSEPPVQPKPVEEKSEPPDEAVEPPKFGLFKSPDTETYLLDDDERPDFAAMAASVLEPNDETEKTEPQEADKPEASEAPTDFDLSATEVPDDETKKDG